MLKSKTLAYNERRNVFLRDLSHAQDTLKFLSARPLYVEKWVPFFKEIVLMVVLTAVGQTYSYTVLETVLRYLSPCIWIFNLQRALKIEQLAARAYLAWMFLMTDGAFNSLFHSQVS